MTTNDFPPDMPQGTVQNTIPLLLGHPDPTMLLTSALHEAMLRAINSPQSVTALQYGPERGTSSLINFLIGKIEREQGLSLRPENVMVVAGSTHAVDMLARLFVEPGGEIG